MKYVVRLDYASMLFAPGTVGAEQISSLLTDKADCLSWQPLARPDRVDTRTPLNCPSGIFFRPDCGYDLAPHYVAFSGVGCENFRSVLPRLADHMYKSPNTHFKRLDFNFDVLMSKTEWREFLCSVFSHQWDKRRNKLVLLGSGDGSTVYVGSRVSEFYFRIYNKSLEDPDFRGLFFDGSPLIADDDSFIIRYEIEFKFKTRQTRGEDCSFDPSPLFASYYGNPSSLFDMIRSLWLEKAGDVVLPAGFESADFVTDLAVTNLPVWTCNEPISARIREIAQNDDFVQKDFWKKLCFSRRYARYFVYYAFHPEWLQQAIYEAKSKFGFHGSIEVTYVPSSDSDLDCVQCESFYNPVEFADLGSVPDFLFPSSDGFENIKI